MAPIVTVTDAPSPEARAVISDGLDLYSREPRRTAMKLLFPAKCLFAVGCAIGCLGTTASRGAAFRDVRSAIRPAAYELKVAPEPGLSAIQPVCFHGEALQPTETFKYHDKVFEIPDAYIESANPETADILARARYPSFAPFCGSKPTPEMGPQEWDGELIILASHNLPTSLTVMLSRVEKFLGPRGASFDRYGLKAGPPGPGSDPYWPETLYLNREGQLSSVIVCNYLRFGGGCQQMFSSGLGLMQVSYAPRLLPYWRQIQAGVSGLLQQWGKGGRGSVRRAG